MPEMISSLVFLLGLPLRFPKWRLIFRSDLENIEGLEDMFNRISVQAKSVDVCGARLSMDLQVRLYRDQIIPLDRGL